MSIASSQERSFSKRILYSLNLSGSRNDDIINSRYKNFSRLLFMTERGNNPNIIKGPAYIIIFIKFLFIHFNCISIYFNLLYRFVDLC
jgi:hypothetical protein